jgi:hypothetical protein
MKESYREGVANHPGPEPCEGSREAALEALDRGICRLDIELRKSRSREADGVRQSGRPQRDARQRESSAGPAESKTPCVQRNSVRENRETPLPPASGWRAGGRTQ